MALTLSTPASRFRVVVTQFFRRFGFGDDSFLLILAVIVGVVTALAAVGFHELIVVIRDVLYTRVSPEVLYGRGVWLLAVFPTAGGLAVGLVSRYVLRARRGTGSST